MQLQAACAVCEGLPAKINGAVEAVSGPEWFRLAATFEGHSQAMRGALVPHGHACYALKARNSTYTVCICWTGWGKAGSHSKRTIPFGNCKGTVTAISVPDVTATSRKPLAFRAFRCADMLG